MKNEMLYGHTAEEWMLALLDILDGSANANDIHYNTGLNEERCKEIAQMFNDATKAGWPQREARGDQ
jgi:hypothetical protein